MECVMIEKLNFSLVEAFYVRIRILVPSGSLSIISQRYYFEQFMTNTDIYLNLKRNIADRYNIFSQKAFCRIYDDLINFFFSWNGCRWMHLSFFFEQHHYLSVLP